MFNFIAGFVIALVITAKSFMWITGGIYTPAKQALLTCEAELLLRNQTCKLIAVVDKGEE